MISPEVMLLVSKVSRSFPGALHPSCLYQEGAIVPPMEVMLLDVDQQGRYGNEFSSWRMRRVLPHRPFSAPHTRPHTPWDNIMGKSASDATTFEKVFFSQLDVLTYYQSNIL
jgi:hypothetical protein